MPTPLIAKRPPAPAPTEQVIWLVFISGPLFAFWFCWNRHQAIHLDNHWLNLAIHAALFVVPLIWAGLMYNKPVVYESQDGETILGTSTNFSRWRLNWWMMFLMWATPVFAVGALAQAFFTRYLPHAESLTTFSRQGIRHSHGDDSSGRFLWRDFAGTFRSGDVDFERRFKDRHSPIS